MRGTLYNAVFAAGITLVLTCLMLGVQLNAEGTALTVQGADAERWTWIIAGIALVFFVQLFSPQIDAFFGRMPKPNLAAGTELSININSSFRQQAAR